MKEKCDAMPWNYIDTYGRSVYNDNPGQAHLRQWPLKLKMIAPLSPYFHRAHIILSADCAAYSFRAFHDVLMKNRVLLIGCPEADGGGFAEKLAEILRLNDILSVALVRMDAPCCSGMADAVVEAVRRSRKDIPIQITTVFAEGEIIE